MPPRPDLRWTHGHDLTWTRAQKVHYLGHPTAANLPVPDPCQLAMSTPVHHVRYFVELLCGSPGGALDAGCPRS
eukprot:1806215-Prorocentrum_lima.AAC.1